jgi:hypothetical protein
MSQFESDIQNTLMKQLNNDQKIFLSKLSDQLQSIILEMTLGDLNTTMLEEGGFGGGLNFGDEPRSENPFEGVTLDFGATTTTAVSNNNKSAAAAALPTNTINGGLQSATAPPTKTAAPTELGNAIRKGTDLTEKLNLKIMEVRQFLESNNVSGNLDEILTSILQSPIQQSQLHLPEGSLPALPPKESSTYSQDFVDEEQSEFPEYLGVDREKWMRGKKNFKDTLKSKARAERGKELRAMFNESSAASLAYSNAPLEKDGGGDVNLRKDSFLAQMRTGQNDLLPNYADVKSQINTNNYSFDVRNSTGAQRIVDYATQDFSNVKSKLDSSRRASEVDRHQPSNRNSYYGRGSVSIISPLEEYAGVINQFETRNSIGNANLPSLRNSKGFKRSQKDAFIHKNINRLNEIKFQKERNVFWVPVPITKLEPPSSVSYRHQRDLKTLMEKVVAGKYPPKYPDMSYGFGESLMDDRETRTEKVSRLMKRLGIKKC